MTVEPDAPDRLGGPDIRLSTAARAPALDRRALIEFVLDNLVWFMLAIVLAIFSLAIPNFFQIGIFANIIEQSTFVGVVSIGLAIVIIAGNMDLSVESTMALAAMVTGILFASRSE